MQAQWCDRWRRLATGYYMSTHIFTLATAGVVESESRRNKQGEARRRQHPRCRTWGASVDNNKSATWRGSTIRRLPQEFGIYLLGPPIPESGQESTRQRNGGGERRGGAASASSPIYSPLLREAPPTAEALRPRKRPHCPTARTNQSRRNVHAIHPLFLELALYCWLSCG